MKKIEESPNKYFLPFIRLTKKYIVDNPNLREWDEYTKILTSNKNLKLQKILKKKRMFVGQNLKKIIKLIYLMRIH